MSDDNETSTMELPEVTDISNSVELIMNQAMEKAVARVASHLDDCLEELLEPKVTAVLKKIAAGKAAENSSHNVADATERRELGNHTHNVPDGAGSSQGGHPPNAADAVGVVHQRGGADAYDVDTISLSGTYMFNEMFDS